MDDSNELLSDKNVDWNEAPVESAHEMLGGGGDPHAEGSVKLKKATPAQADQWDVIRGKLIEGGAARNEQHQLEVTREQIHAAAREAEAEGKDIDLSNYEGEDDAQGKKLVEEIPSPDFGYVASHIKAVEGGDGRIVSFEIDPEILTSIEFVLFNTMFDGNEALNVKEHTGLENGEWLVNEAKRLKSIIKTAKEALQGSDDTMCSVDAAVAEEVARIVLLYEDIPGNAHNANLYNGWFRRHDPVEFPARPRYRWQQRGYEKRVEEYREAMQQKDIAETESARQGLCFDAAHQILTSLNSRGESGESAEAV